MSRITQATKHLLQKIGRFSHHLLNITLHHYQKQPAQAITTAVLQKQGLEFLLIFPRQSGKNETTAVLIVYLLNLLQRVGGNIVFGAIGDGLGRMIDRIEQRLDNPLNANVWTKKTKPTRRLIGKAAVAFLSSSPTAHARGETAHHLLIIDELQDQDPAHIEAVFTPMRAANNATALYLGTVKFTHDALWQKKKELEHLQAQDGRQRVFLVSPEQVTAENPAYGRFLANQIAKYGRHHPIIASEYFLEPIDGAGGLFPPRRLALMRGQHLQQHTPAADALHIATIDVAGQDEAATDPLAQLHNPARDYTIATIYRVNLPQDSRQPRYEALTVFADRGSRHFQSTPGQPSLATRLLAFLDHWQVAHVVVDASGVGEGLTDWLTAELPGRITGYKFQGTGKKAQIGSQFISLIETGRFKYFTNPDPTVRARQLASPPTPNAQPQNPAVSPLSPNLPLSDSWHFFTQAAACTYEVPPNGRFDTHLKWGVPATHKTPTPQGPQHTHDDYLLSAALIAHMDQLITNNEITIGRAASAVAPHFDPLDNMEF